MTIEQIPSDELTAMTDTFYKAFKASGCKPRCHCCSKEIKTNNFFKLGTVVNAPKIDSVSSGYSKWQETESREVMLCDECSVDDYNNMSVEAIKSYEEYRKKGGGCFRVNGKIIH